MTLLKTHDSAASADKPRPARGSVSRTSIRRAHACRSHQRRGLRPRATEVPRDGLCLVYSFCMPSRRPVRVSRRPSHDRAPPGREPAACGWGEKNILVYTDSRSPKR